MTASKTDSMRRAVVFAHFDRDNIVDDYVVYYVQSLRSICNRLVFVSTSALPENEVQKIRNMCDDIVVRENIGYDFMSYKTGLYRLIKEEYDEIVLCNDSCYGPLFPIDEVFTRMCAQECDFWGITENHEIAYHIQSYFLVFRKRVLGSDVFRKFWEDVTVKQKKEEIIKEYEVGLSQVLISNGFRARTYISLRPSIMKLLAGGTITINFKKIFNYKSWSTFIKNMVLVKEKRLNPTILLWKQLIKEHKMPFMKVALLKDTPPGTRVRAWEDVVKQYTTYDVKLIKKHLERMCPKENSK